MNDSILATDIPEALRAIRVQQRTIDIQAASIVLVLNCGHTLTMRLADFPLIRVVDTLNVPEVGEPINCPSCGLELPIILGEISDEIATSPDQSSTLSASGDRSD